MYIVGNKIYSDVGKILATKGRVCWQSDDLTREWSEVDVNLDNICVERGIIIIMKYYLRIADHPTWSYAQWKAAIVKWRYSNDDQIAIMLNKDNSEEDMDRFNKMQAWREWSGILANKLINIER